jgi:hypothetical protein
MRKGEISGSETDEYHGQLAVFWVVVVAIGYEAKRASEPVWAQRLEEKSFASAAIEHR